ncbi:PREDICTED: toll-like receptor 1 [Acropora digitifera]|nr:PREDICTED: toll-like receptor 1 [Acropora digitifera]
MVVAAVIWRRFVERGNEEMDVALLDLGFKFDAFIIYSTTDEQWVKKKLLSTLEKKHNMKCCIHYRDFLPGVPFVENMAQSVYNSRKTIAVVSKSFLSSNYCNHELNIALHRLVERGDNSVIVIKLDDVEDSKLPIELQFRSYIDFTKASDKKTWEYKLVHSFIGERC